MLVDSIALVIANPDKYNFDAGYLPASVGSELDL